MARKKVPKPLKLAPPLWPYHIRYSLLPTYNFHQDNDECCIFCPDGYIVGGKEVQKSYRNGAISLENVFIGALVEGFDQKSEIHKIAPVVAGALVKCLTMRVAENENKVRTGSRSNHEVQHLLPFSLYYYDDVDQEGEYDIFFDTKDKPTRDQRYDKIRLRLSELTPALDVTEIEAVIDITSIFVKWWDEQVLQGSDCGGDADKGDELRIGNIPSTMMLQIAAPSEPPLLSYHFCYFHGPADEIRNLPLNDCFVVCRNAILMFIEIDEGEEPREAPLDQAKLSEIFLKELDYTGRGGHIEEAKKKVADLLVKCWRRRKEEEEAISTQLDEPYHPQLRPLFARHLYSCPPSVDPDIGPYTLSSEHTLDEILENSKNIERLFSRDTEIFGPKDVACMMWFIRCWYQQ